MKKFLLALGLIITFLFTRFYRIDTSLYFFNDMGRDLLVLLEWQKNHQIPFLGPQTSALPINQSPLYYFFLMPFYLLLKASPYSALIANAVVYVICFLLGLYLTRSYPILTKATLITFLFFIFHPQYVAQNRFVWNPSLLSPLIFLSLIFFLTDSLFFSVLFLSLAISLNYSVFPLLLVFFLIILVEKRQFLLKFILYTTGLLTLFNLSILAQLGKRLIFTGTLIRGDQIYQIGNSFGQKLTDYSRYVLGIQPSLVVTLFLVVTFSLSLYLSLFSMVEIRKLSARIFLGTSILTLLSPFNLQAHYIFAITTSFFLFLSLLNWKITLPLVFFLFFFYLQPTQVSSYFKPAPRTYQQMDACFKQFCSQFQQPVFVSVQSDLYPYHYGPEHRYLMMKNGCQVRHIEKEPQAANYMAVVLDSGSFSEKTRYYELDLFGKFREWQRFNCQSNFSVVLLTNQNIKQEKR